MDIDQRLINWGRYWRDRARRSHCYSIEHRFKSPPEPEISAGLADWLYARGMISDAEREKALEGRYQARVGAPDADDAYLIELAWIHVPHETSKEFLRLVYVKRKPAWYVCRKLKVDFGRELMLSHAAIEIELREIGNRNRFRNTGNESIIKRYKTVTTRLIESLAQSPMRGLRVA